VQLGLYVFTVNAFPYGEFHGRRVKEDVYRPDWLEAERVHYTDRVAHLLAALVPDGCGGSISTVPGAFKLRAPAESDAAVIAERLFDHANTLFQIRENKGKLIELALEPEPHCFLETSEEAVRFFEHHIYSANGVARFASLSGLSQSDAEAFLRRHLGVCLDACHLAVEFEDAGAAVARLRSAGVRVGKIQITTALRAELSGSAEQDEPTFAALDRFADGVYLHQVVTKTDDVLVRHLDLPEAIAQERASNSRSPSEWRIHFHVPVFAERIEPFASTSGFLADLLAITAAAPVSEHLEVETYTWDVLPPEHRGTDVDEAVARELAFTLARLGATPPTASVSRK
jgi:hypothetical protein